MMRTQTGDMARWASSARHTQQIKTNINRLTDELAAKKHHDMPRALGADRALHFELTTAHQRLEAFQSNGRSLALRLQVAQSAVGNIGNTAESLARDLLRNPDMLSEVDIGLAVSEGENSFVAMVSSLNMQAGGRTVFAGARTDTAPLPDAQAILADLRANVDFTGSAAAIQAEVEAYFESATGPYEATHYAGGAPVADGVAISENRRAGVALTALNPAFRTALAGAAMVAIAEDGPMVNDHERKVDLLMAARDKMLDRSALAALESQIGSVQQQTDHTIARNAARMTSLGIEINSLEQPDEYDAVNRLLEAQSQLEMHFTVTNRLSKLSFLNFMS